MSNEIAAGPTELEMHRLAYKMVQAAGFQEPEELLAAYNGLKHRYETQIESIQTLSARLAESDRMLGEATREAVHYKQHYDREREWLRKAKRDAGYEENSSFDVVWDAALSALKSNRINLDLMRELLEAHKAHAAYKSLDGQSTFESRRNRLVAAWQQVEKALAPRKTS